MARNQEECDGPKAIIGNEIEELRLDVGHLARIAGFESLDALRAERCAEAMRIKTNAEEKRRVTDEARTQAQNAALEELALEQLRAGKIIIEIEGERVNVTKVKALSDLRTKCRDVNCAYRVAGIAREAAGDLWQAQNGWNKSVPLQKTEVLQCKKCGEGHTVKVSVIP